MKSNLAKAFRVACSHGACRSKPSAVVIESVKNATIAYCLCRLHARQFRAKRVLETIPPAEWPPLTAAP